MSLDMCGGLLLQWLPGSLPELCFWLSQRARLQEQLAWRLQRKRASWKPLKWKMFRGVKIFGKK